MLIWKQKGALDEFKFVLDFNWRGVPSVPYLKLSKKTRQRI